MNKLFAKHEWYNPELQKKSRIYSYVAWATIAFAVIFYLSVREMDNSKTISMIALIVGAVFAYLSSNLKNQDTKEREQAQLDKMAQLDKQSKPEVK